MPVHSRGNWPRTISRPVAEAVSRQRAQRPYHEMFALRTKRETWLRQTMSLALIRSSPAVDLNPEQQLAVEHGIGDPQGSGPLLVIAGAGSGKTAMLAHRVAALILAGADPKRVMLATFSRRAAAELGRRVERLLARRLAPEAAAAATPAYAGTFHALGARLLREYATRLGLDPQFTIHDREDSADLMNWGRHEMGVGDLKERFPTKATCLTIYSR